MGHKRLVFIYLTIVNSREIFEFVEENMTPQCAERPVEEKGEGAGWRCQALEDRSMGNEELIHPGSCLLCCFNTRECVCMCWGYSSAGLSPALRGRSPF